MKFEVYCDEAHPDVLTSKNPHAKFLMIGSLWIPSALRGEIKTKLKKLREEHNVWGEVKWTKISPSKKNFYLALVRLFHEYGSSLRFRCIAVQRDQISEKLLGGDQELGFYKFYYQLLHHWILDFNEYSIFCDVKTNHDPKRVPVLHKCLSNANLQAEIKTIQSLPSSEVVLIQLCDLLLGIASARMNKTLHPGTAKSEVVESLENLLQVKEFCQTNKQETKFNIFKIQLQGGW